MLCTHSHSLLSPINDLCTHLLYILERSLKGFLVPKSFRGWRFTLLVSDFIFFSENKAGLDQMPDSLTTDMSLLCCQITFLHVLRSNWLIYLISIVVPIPSCQVTKSMYPWQIQNMNCLSPFPTSSTKPTMFSCSSCMIHFPSILLPGNHRLWVANGWALQNNILTHKSMDFGCRHNDCWLLTRNWK